MRDTAACGPEKLLGELHRHPSGSEDAVMKKRRTRSSSDEGGHVRDEQNSPVTTRAQEDGLPQGPITSRNRRGREPAGFPSAKH